MTLVCVPEMEREGSAVVQSIGCKASALIAQSNQQGPRRICTNVHSQKHGHASVSTEPFELRPRKHAVDCAKVVGQQSALRSLICTDLCLLPNNPIVTAGNHNTTLNDVQLKAV